MGIKNTKSEIRVRIGLEDESGVVTSYTVGYGDIITDLKCYEAEPVTGRVVKLGVMHEPTIAPAHSNYDGIPFTGWQPSDCGFVCDFEEIMRVNELVLEDDTCAHHHVRISSIESIGSVTPGRVYVTPDDDLAAKIDALEEGQILWLCTGTYETDLTISKAVIIDGDGSGAVTLKGNVTIATENATDLVSINHIAIENDAVASTGMVTITSGNLILFEDKLTVNNAEGIAECSAIQRAVSTSDVNTRIVISHCSIRVVGGVAGDFNYAVAIGAYDSADMGAIALYVEGSCLEATHSGIYCTARGVADISIRNSKVTGWDALYMKRNGETETVDTFDVSFPGSKVHIRGCQLTGIQRQLAAADPTTECNGFSVLPIQNCKGLIMTVEDSQIRVLNDITDETKTSVFAPMTALEADETYPSEMCQVRVDNCHIDIMDPVCAAAISVAGDTNGLVVANSRVFGYTRNNKHVPLSLR